MRIFTAPLSEKAESSWLVVYIRGSRYSGKYKGVSGARVFGDMVEGAGFEPA
jgi:hypothetical protein